MTGISQKAVALLAYLVVEADKSHRREMLADLLWPRATLQDGLNSLRQVLWSLRRAFQPAVGAEPCLRITREAVQFNSACAYELDYGDFLACVSDLLRSHPSGAWPADTVTRAIRLYRGSFLADLALHDANRFEEWLLYRREHVDQVAFKLLQQLSARHEASPEHVLEYAQRILAIDPYNELAYQMMMRTLMRAGQRSKALQKYEKYRLMLKEDFNLEPGGAILQLYRAIREHSTLPDDLLLASERTGGRSAALTALPAPFVARQKELDRLVNCLDQAMNGQGRGLFLTGESGSGKTTLLREFAYQARQTWPGLLVLWGSCSAVKIDTPYQPFREMISGLFVEGCLDEPAVLPVGETGRRPAGSLPGVLADTLAQAASLVEAFSIPPNALKPGPAEPAAPARSAESAAQPPAFRQEELFSQFTRTLQTISEQHALLIVVDDLQWAGPETLALLFYFSCRLARQRILLVGAFRSGELEPADEEARGSLTNLVNELQRIHGERVVDLDRSDGRIFVENFLDAIPNQFSPAFHDQLFRVTGGQPLFTVELFKYFCESRSLLQDKTGVWHEDASIPWDHIPARVEAVIARRIQNLPVLLRDLLGAASVEGEVFTQQVLVRLVNLDEEKIQAVLRGSLGQINNFVAAERLERVNGKRLARFRFRHILFQRYLYENLDLITRSNLHEGVALALEELYGWQGVEKVELDNGRTLEATAQLARHYQLANLPVKASEYHYLMGNLAYRISALEESIACFRRGIALLEPLSDDPKTIQLKIDLYFGLGNAVGMHSGWGGTEQMAAYNRAFDLSRSQGTIERLAQALKNLAATYLGQGDFQKSLVCSQNLLQLAEHHQHRIWLAQARFLIGQAQYTLGNLISAEDYLRQFILQLPLPEDTRLITLGMDAWSSAYLWLATVRALRGDLKEAHALRWQGLHESESSGAWHTRPFGLVQNWILLYLLGSPIEELEPVMQAIDEEVTGKKLVAYYSWVWAIQGALLVRRGQLDEGIHRIRQSIAETQKLGSRIGYPFRLVLLAEAYGLRGETQKALQVVAEGLTYCERSNIAFFKSSLLRIKGELLARQGDLTGAEENLANALQVAQALGSRLWQLQAGQSWAQVAQEHGLPAEDCQRLLNRCD